MFGNRQITPDKRKTSVSKNSASEAAVNNPASTLFYQRCQLYPFKVSITMATVHPLPTHPLGSPAQRSANPSRLSRGPSLLGTHGKLRLALSGPAYGRVPLFLRRRPLQPAPTPHCLSHGDRGSQGLLHPGLFERDISNPLRHAESVWTICFLRHF